MWRLHPKSSSNEEVTRVILIQSNEDSMWCHYDVLSHMRSPSSNEEMPCVILIHNSSSNEESTCGIWEDLQLMKVLSRRGFILRSLKSVEWVPHNF